MKLIKSLHNSNFRMAIMLSIITLLLIIPAIAVQFTNEVNWSISDFVIAGILLVSTGTAIELIIRNFTSGTFRTIALVVVLICLFLIWAELAVGIFGTPLAGS